ncbi:MAG: hypothetical protein ACE5ET_08120 [Gammaproteobacteria bacterium]
MERLNERLAVAEKAHATQQYLHAVEGRECASPKSCLRGIGEAGILNAEETRAGLRMTDDRNRTVHLYHEALAEEIYAHLPAHSRLIGKILHGIRGKMSSSCA